MPVINLCVNTAVCHVRGLQRWTSTELLFNCKSPMETHIFGMPSLANDVLVCAVVKDDQIAVQFVVLCWLHWVFWGGVYFYFFLHRDS